MKMQYQATQADNARRIGEPMQSIRRHAGATIAMHWISALALVLAAAAGIVREWVEDDAMRALLMQVHKQAGLCVLLALALRLAIRLRLGFPDHAGAMPRILRLAAQLAHLALYALLAGLPLLGLAVCSASAMDVSLFGLFRLPALVQDDPDLAATLSDWHVWAAWAMLGMVTAHVAAALWHHLLRRDGVLVAMLPLLRRRAPQAPSAAAEAMLPPLRSHEFPPQRDAA
jgi:cytochrome b561